MTNHQSPKSDVKGKYWASVLKDDYFALFAKSGARWAFRAAIAFTATLFATGIVLLIVAGISGGTSTPNLIAGGGGTAGLVIATWSLTHLSRVWKDKKFFEFMQQLLYRIGNFDAAKQDDYALDLAKIMLEWVGLKESLPGKK